jgi:xylan 1,4-beta-xylosidase
VLHVVRMFGMMKGKRVNVSGNRMYDLRTFVDSSVRRQTDIGAMAAKDKNSATIMVWNYHDEDKQEAAAEINIAIDGLSANAITLTEYRIDNEHSNSYEAWKKMGSPQHPGAEQIVVLEKAGQLEMFNKPVKMKANNKITLKIKLPRQGVSLLKLEW